MELSEVFEILAKYELSDERVKLAFKRPDGSTVKQAEYMTPYEARVSADVLDSVGCTIVAVYRLDA